MNESINTGAAALQQELSREKRCIYFVHSFYAICDWIVTTRTNTVKVSPEIEEIALMRLAISVTFTKIFHRARISSSVRYCYSRFKIFANLLNGNLKSAICYRFTIHKGEVFRFPSECQELHVLSGIAWITVAGEDIILTSEKTASLASNKDAIISPLGNVPLILEVL